jgi:hypothetical protein
MSCNVYLIKMQMLPLSMMRAEEPMTTVSAPADVVVIQVQPRTGEVKYRAVDFDDKSAHCIDSIMIFDYKSRLSHVCCRSNKMLNHVIES